MATFLQKTFQPNVYGKKAQMKKEIKKNKSLLESSLANIPTYEIPPEVQQYLNMLSQTSTQLGEAGERAKDIYGESVDIAKSQSAMQEAPGAGIARDDIKQSTAQQIQNIKEAGGGGVGALGAISNVGLSEQDSLRDLAKQSALYKAQAAQNLQGALSGQAGFESNLDMNILGQQAALKGTGLQTMIGEKGKVQQSELDKYLTMTDYQLQQLGVSQQDLENLKNRRAQLLGGIIGGVTGGVSSYLTGGLAGKK